MAEEKTNVQDQTTVEQVDIDLSDIFDAAPGGDSMVSTEEEKKPSIFAKSEDVDLSFLEEEDSEESTDADASEETKEETKEETTEDLDDLLELPGDEDDQEEEQEEKPKREKKK